LSPSRGLRPPQQASPVASSRAICYVNLFYANGSAGKEKINAMNDTHQVAPHYFDSLWKFFASVKLTVVILLSLAATSIIGTIVPQNLAPMDYLKAYGPFIFRIYSVLDIFDMYHSWWFQLMLLLLTINIAICSVDRLSATWRIIFPSQSRLNPGRFQKLKNQQTFQTRRPAEEIRALAAPWLAKSFRHQEALDTDKGYILFAEKGRLTRLGVYAVHSSILLLVVGGLIGSLFGFEGYVNIPEGQTVDSIRLRNTSQIQKLEFGIRCDKFSLSVYDNGMPKEYRSSLTILKNGQPVLHKDIIVNDPLRYQGINIFQSSYGQLPSNSPAQGPPKPEAPKGDIELSFTSQETGMTYQKTAAIGQPIDLPEGLGKFTLVEYKPNAQYRGQEIGEALVGILTPAKGPPQEVLLSLRFANFDKMRQGKVFISVLGQKGKPAAPATPPQVRYYTGLQVTRDPGVWVVYLGFGMLILGCYITFFTSHQQVCLEVAKSGHQQRITLSGVANKNKSDLDRKLGHLSEKLRELIAD
jgi:cytochrome c biogenesis protein